MADYPTVATVLDRLLAAGIARHHAERHLRYGRVRVDGAPVTDPHAVVPDGAPVVLRGTEATR
jgi:predicted ATPase